MPAASVGRIKVAIPGGSTFFIKPASLVTNTVARLSPVQRQSNDISYDAYDSRGGLTWDVFDRAYLGCGRFLADDGGYGLAENADLRWGRRIIPGPRIEADYPGIPSGVKVLGTCTWNTTHFVWTDSATAATNKVFRLESGIWVDRSAGLPAAQVKCMVAMGDHVAVGFGTAARYEYTATPSGTISWTDNAGPANEPESYMSVAAVMANDDGAVGARVVYAVQTNTTSITGSNNAGEVFFTTSLVGGTVGMGIVTAGSYVGEGGSSSQDDFVSIAVATDGNLLFGKRRRLYNYDVAGVVTDAIGVELERKSTSDDGASGVPENFRDPVVMPNGYIYWIVGDYDILERTPSGDYSYKSPRLFGPDTPVMQLPVLAITNVENELYVALGTTSTSVFDVTKFPGGEQLLANTITDGATYLFAGAYRTGPQGEDLGWVYHGALSKLSTLTGFMWYAADLKRLFLSASEIASGAAKVISTQDNLATASDYTGVALILSSQGTAADGDYWYAGSPIPFSGVYFSGFFFFNSNPAEVTGKYWNGSAWVNAGVTDTTQNPAGTTLGQVGYYSWTVPTDWVKDDLVTINSPAPGASVPYRTDDLYWMRFEYNAALDAAVATDAAVQLFGTVQRVARVVPGNPLTFKMDGSNVILSPDDWTVETGKYVKKRPNVVGTARRVQSQGSGWASDDPKLRIYYRVADDDDTATGFSELPASTTYTNGFTSVANARTGTAFPNNTEFRGIRLQVKSDDDGVTNEYTYGIVYGVQLMWLSYDDRQQQVSFSFVGSNATVTPEGVASGHSRKGWKDLITEWQDARTPATITLVETGYSWPMDLVDGYPAIDHITNAISVVAREVVA